MGSYCEREFRCGKHQLKNNEYFISGNTYELASEFPTGVSFFLNLLRRVKPIFLDGCPVILKIIADAYISYLMTVDELEFADENDCGDWFAGNDPREQIAIFRLV